MCHQACFHLPTLLYAIISHFVCYRWPILFSYLPLPSSPYCFIHVASGYRIITQPNSISSIYQYHNLRIYVDLAISFTRCGVLALSSQEYVLLSTTMHHRIRIESSISFMPSCIIASIVPVCTRPLWFYSCIPLCIRHPPHYLLR
jgi:hypothetical protein